MPKQILSGINLDIMDLHRCILHVEQRYGPPRPHCLKLYCACVEGRNVPLIVL